MDTKGKAGDALQKFYCKFGIPMQLIVDGSGKQMGKNTELMRQALANGICLKIAEPQFT